MHFVRTARAFSFVAMLVAVTVLLAGCCGKAPVKEQPDSPVWSVEISPVEDTNPTKTQHTFVVTVYDRDGRPVPNVQVHWILARTGDAVGDIVAFDDQDLGESGAKALTRKTDNQYSVSYTNEQPQTLHRGNRWVAEEARWTDFEVGAGQTWCTITSPVEGDSHMIAYVPAIQDGLRHKVFAVKHWQRVPHLTVAQECAERVHVGMEFDYAIAVENDGEGATPGDVMVMDSLPEGLQIVDDTTFPVNLGVLEPGDVEAFTVRVRADTRGTKVNLVEARAGEFVARADCTTEVYGSGIEILKDCTERVILGDVVTFNIRVTNTEAAALEEVVVTDAMPDGLEFLEAVASVGEGVVVEGLLTWDGFDLAPGASADLTVTARTTEMGDFTNIAAAAANVVGTEFTVSDEDDCAFVVGGLPELQIEKICVQTEVGLGEPVTFKIKVWNSGAAAATNVDVTDLMPEGLQATGETSWVIGNLLPGEENAQTIEVTATAMKGGQFTNIATASISTDEATAVRDSCDVRVIMPMLTIKKECMAVNPILERDITVLNRMDNAKHIITVQNGEAVAQDVVVVDTIPLGSDGDENIRYLGSNPAGVYNATTHTVTWNLGTLQPNQTVAIEVEFQGIDVGPSINTAKVTARGFAGAQDECRLYILGSPAFQEATVDVLDGDPAADNFEVGQEFYYVTMVQNEGEADLMINMSFTLTEELEMVGTTVGFIPSLTSTGAPTQTFALTALGANKFQVKGFSLSPGEQKWIRINVVGRKATAVDAAEINIDLNWQLWYDGQLFPKKGKVTSSETTVIDPQ